MTNQDYNKFFDTMNEKRESLNNEDWLNIAKYVYKAMKDKGWSRIEVVEAAPELLGFLLE